MDKKEFAAAAFDPESETFAVHVASLSSVALSSSFPLNVHPFRRPQIAGLIAKETSIKVPAEYADFVDVFSPDLASELPEHTGINDHAIKLVNGQQPLYGPIYTLGPVEPSKSPTGAPFFFDQKLDGSLWLYVDYTGLNNLTIKNWYPLPLVGESLNRLGKARLFTQLDLTRAYHWIRIHKGDKGKTVCQTW